MRVHPSQLMTASLRASTHGGSIARILAAALEAVNPREAIHQSIKVSGHIMRTGGRDYDLSSFGRIFVVGAGKAGTPMLEAIHELLSDRLTEGIVIVKEGHGSLKVSDSVVILEAGHPIPDDRGLEGTQRIIQLLRQAREEDLVICLISGGGSALLNSPIAGISLSSIQKLTAILLKCGATINEINTLRKHLDGIKGGGLARIAYPAKILTLILSDVMGDPLDVIASGPTVPDPTTFSEAYAVLTKYGIVDHIPKEIVTGLLEGMHAKILETPKEGDPIFRDVHNIVIGNNLSALRAGLETARAMGFKPIELSAHIHGEARQVGRTLGALGRQYHRLASSSNKHLTCLAAGGETTVTIKGVGLGGRNQEVALGAIQELAGLPDILLVALATDGGDGPTDAAGAVVTGDSFERARKLGLDPEDFLNRNDAYHFFEPLGDLLKPGPTYTNVNDLTFIFSLS